MATRTSSTWILHLPLLPIPRRSPKRPRSWVQAWLPQMSRWSCRLEGLSRATRSALALTSRRSIVLPCPPVFLWTPCRQSSTPLTKHATGYVNGDIKAVLGSVLNSDIVAVDRSTTADDDDPAVPGINADEACPSSASLAPTTRAPTNHGLVATTRARRRRLTKTQP